MKSDAEKKIPQGMIRNYRPEDVDQMALIYSEVITGHECCRLQEKISAKCLFENLSCDEQKYEAFVFELNGSILGWAWLSRTHYREAWSITADLVLCVKADARRRAIGTALLLHAERRAIHHQFRSIIILSIADFEFIVKWLTKNGFENICELERIVRIGDRLSNVVISQKMLG